MKKTLTKLALISVLIGLVISGCKKDEAEWKKVEPFTPDTNLTNQLNYIFSKDNTCLLDFDKELVLVKIFSEADFRKVYGCESIPTIDYTKYTVIAGRVTTSTSPESALIFLSLNDESSTYKLDFDVNVCDACAPVKTYLYFWRVYPKLNPAYDLELSLSEN